MMQWYDVMSIYRFPNKATSGVCCSVTVSVSAEALHCQLGCPKMARSHLSELILQWE